ncbi:MAG: helix-turn-helix domain-containing protein [Acidiferrobacteraceae bacterium]
MKRTTDEWQAEIGERLRGARIRQRLEQKELANRANISVSAIKNLEGGKGSTLKSLIHVLRALNLQDLLDALPPADLISPLEVARTGQVRLPQRVVKHRGRR